MHRIRWKDRLDRQIDIIGINWIAQCYPMIQPFAMQVELQYMQSGEMYCIYLPKHAQTISKWPAPQKSRNPQELTWIRGPLIGRGSLGHVFKAVEMEDGQSNLGRDAMLVELFLGGAPLAIERSSDNPINGGFIKSRSVAKLMHGHPIDI